MSKETWILILCFWILLCMSVVEIRNKEARAEVKAALELIKKGMPQPSAPKEDE